jgi:hypothetical protein
LKIITSLEHETVHLKEDLYDIQEELSFVRTQLQVRNPFLFVAYPYLLIFLSQSKSARVTDLEAELLMSHKYANSMQMEIQNLRSSHVEAANQHPLPDNTDELNHEVSSPFRFILLILFFTVF